MAKKIDGKEVAREVRSEVKARVEELRVSHGYTPHLAVILASNDPASNVYVRNKSKAAAEVGIRSTQHTLDPTTSPAELLALIDKLNEDDDVDGILVQLPLPSQHNMGVVLERIDPAKDVDGLHPINAGRLSRGDENCLIPCTPRGTIRLIESVNPKLAGKRAVVLGRSRLVGRPVADLLLNRHATVTVCHSQTVDLADMVRSADILVVAIGRQGYVRGNWVGFGSIVIDVGINRTEDGKLMGDVVFDAAAERAEAITPVPGGVGPMTVAYLLDNTLKAAEGRRR